MLPPPASVTITLLQMIFQLLLAAIGSITHQTIAVLIVYIHLSCLVSLPVILNFRDNLLQLKNQ